MVENDEEQKYCDHCVAAENKWNVCQVECIETFKIERILDQLITDEFRSRLKVGVKHCMFVLFQFSSISISTIVKKRSYIFTYQQALNLQKGRESYATSINFAAAATDLVHETEKSSQCWYIEADI